MVGASGGARVGASGAGGMGASPGIGALRSTSLLPSIVRVLRMMMVLFYKTV